MQLPDSIKSLRKGAEEFQQAQYALVKQIVDEEVARDVTLQGLSGLIGDPLRRQLRAALDEGDD